MKNALHVKLLVRQCVALFYSVCKQYLFSFSLEELFKGLYLGPPTRL